MGNFFLGAMANELRTERGSLVCKSPWHRDSWIVVLFRVCIILIDRRSLPECNSLGKQLKVRSYDYVNRPYEHVRDVLQKDALKVFQAATKAAASRAQTIASELHIEFGGIGVKTDINITVKSVEEKVAEAGVGPITRLLLEWEATAMPRLFPLMKGELSIYPLTSTETQLDFSGIYELPFGPVGKTLNAIVGHRIAEVSVHRFVDDVAGYLRQSLD